MSTFITLLLVGCAATPSEDEKVELIKNKQVKELSRLEQISLTYRFQNAMTRAESNEFYNYIKSDEIIDELGPILENAAHHSRNIASTGLLYSDFWLKAYSTGNLTNSLGLVAVAGLAISALLPENPPLYSSSYFVKHSESQGLTATEVTKVARQKTLNATKDFFNSEGYEVICEKGCSNDLQVEDTAHIRLWVGLKQPQVKAPYHKHRAIQIDMQLLPLIENTVNFPFIDDKVTYKVADKSAWIIYLTGPNTYNSEEEKYGYKFNKLNMPISGTMINRKLFQHLTKEIPGYSAMIRTKGNIHYRIKEAYNNGNAYELYDELTEHSIVKGIHLN